MAASRKAYQDYGSWAAFGTARFWEEALGNPLAVETFAQHFRKLGLHSPLEKTSASLACGALVARYGDAAMSLRNEDIQACYHELKARMQHACTIKLAVNTAIRTCMR